MIRMSHPEHGYHVAYNGAEELALEKTGWKKVTDAEFKAVIAAKSPKSVEEDDAPVEVKKPGRPKNK